jgi:N-methylhydantoinase A
MIDPGRLTRGAVAAAVGALRSSLEDSMDAHAETVSYELRYQGQSFELPVEAGPEPSVEELTEGFAREHKRRYGFAIDDAPVELVAIRLALEGRAAALTPQAGAGDTTEGSRKVCFGGDWHQALVIRGEPPAGASFEGPAVLELPESTLVLPPGWAAEVDAHGAVVAEAAA